MDEELKGTTKSRRLDTLDDMPEGVENENDLNAEDEVTEDVHVLNNLLQSLEASAGKAGPVPNMMKEMGAEPPK